MTSTPPSHRFAFRSVFASTKILITHSHFSSFTFFFMMIPFPTIYSHLFSDRFVYARGDDNPLTRKVYVFLFVLFCIITPHRLGKLHRSSNVIHFEQWAEELANSTVSANSMFIVACDHREVRSAYSSFRGSEI